MYTVVKSDTEKGMEGVIYITDIKNNLGFSQTCVS
jgi:predicted RNA-binding protein with TRAM domain